MKWLERGACFLFSLILHAGLVFLAFHFRFNYKIYTIEDIREVYLAPEKIYIPEEVKLASGLSPGGAPAEFPREFFSGEQGPGVGKNFQDLRAEEDVGQPEGEVGPEAGIKLSLIYLQTPGSPSTSEPGFDLSLRARIEKSQPDLRKTIQPDFSSSRYTGKSPPFKRGAAGGGRSRNDVSAEIEGYDLSPWAEQVANRIQENWVLVPLIDSSSKGQVGISVVIEKSGNVLSMAVATPSEAEAFDQGALKAIRLSLPFPPLPGDFPAEKIELYLLFQYEEK